MKGGSEWTTDRGARTPLQQGINGIQKGGVVGIISREEAIDDEAFGAFSAMF